MIVRMNPRDREFIHEYNYPDIHKQILMYGIHEVEDIQGSCYRIMIDNEAYYVSKYDMIIVNDNRLPEGLFHV